MLVHAHRAPVFATNTLVVAARRGGRALIVDPGAGVAAAVRRTLGDLELSVAGVVLTHGHPDHVWDCAELAGTAPVHIGAADAERLGDPLAYLGGGLDRVFGREVPSWQPPGTVAPISDGEELDLDGLTLRATAAPGHTPGSTVWRLDGKATLQGPPFAEIGLSRHDGALVLTGDVLFAGSIGRCDLPGGDERQMGDSLATLTAAIPADAVLVPGHGPATRMSRELATNPFLATPPPAFG